MKLQVVIESPYAGDHASNIAYARLCLLDSIRRGEVPLMGHLLYTQVLNDTDPAARELGIDLHAKLIKNFAQKLVVCTDRGISRGMQFGIDVATSLKIPVHYRTLGAIKSYPIFPAEWKLP